jgi:lysophospholipase L1-like esterase
MGSVEEQRSWLAARLKVTEPLLWLFCGDSITQGTAHTRGYRDFSQLFKERLCEMGRNRDIIVNTAVSGWSIQALLPHVEERILRFRPEAVFLLFGTNDAARGQEGIAAYEEGYRSVLRQIRGIGARLVVVQTLPPMVALDAERALAPVRYDNEAAAAAKKRGLRMRLEFLPAFAEAARRVAAAEGALLIDHSEAWETTRQTNTVGELLDGGFHPNEYGHRLLAHTIFRALGLWSEESWTCRLFVPVRTP